MMTLYTSTSLARDTVAILYYSIVLSAITVVVAICIGTIQLLSLISNFSEGKFWDGVDVVSDHYDILGGAICGSFVIFGVLSVIVYRPWRKWMESERQARMTEEGDSGTQVKRGDDDPKKQDGNLGNAGDIGRSSVDIS